MIRSKLGLLTLCTGVLGVMGLSASSAQATFSWLVLNPSETAATELKAALFGEKDNPELSLLTKLGGLNIRITCTTFELIGFNLEVGGKLTEGGNVKLTGCYQQGASGEVACEQHSSGQAGGVIVTNELKSELVLHAFEGGGTEVLAKVEPKVAGGAFTTIFTKEGCPAFSGISVSGNLYLKDGLGQATTHAVKHLLQVGPLTGLFVGKAAATLDDSVWVKLGGAHLGLKWSAMDI